MLHFSSNQALQNWTHLKLNFFLKNCELSHSDAVIFVLQTYKKKKKTHNKNTTYWQDSETVFHIFSIIP